ncbi:MAG TPA: MFS transporter [Rhodocyclaceae bacterium]|nr:MFS transporter [Rhodocyclaceae bacterium]
MNAVGTEPPPSARPVVVLCAAEVLSMTGFATWPALLPELEKAWGLSGTEAGAIGGAYFAGYMVAVSWLSGLTDRLDARKVYFFSCLLAALGTLGFALFARGAPGAILFQAIAGAGLAGTYMPGLKAMTDRVGGSRQPRYIAFYTSTFGVGASLSYALTGAVAAGQGWQVAVLVAAAGPVLAGLLALRGLAPVAPQGGRHRASVFSQFRVLREPATLGYVAGYAVHCWELFGLRSWIVALVAFSVSIGDGAQPLAAATAAAAVNLVGIPASILGNEIAGRVGRRRFILAVMATSGALAWAVGLSLASPWALLALLFLYNVSIMADSAALTAGLVAATDPTRRGGALAVYSLFGFGAGFFGPFVFGAVLDHAGGTTAPVAWIAACGSLGLGCLLAPAVARAARSRA